MAALAFYTDIPVREGFVLGVETAKADDLPNSCAAPNQISPNIAETAWQLWVAATCPVNQNKYPFVVWENWIEQAQMYPTDPLQRSRGAERRGSRLQRRSSAARQPTGAAQERDAEYRRAGTARGSRPEL